MVILRSNLNNIISEIIIPEIIPIGKEARDHLGIMIWFIVLQWLHSTSVRL